MSKRADMIEEGQALSWIVELLRRSEAPFQVVGGLAARAYGARRPLVDLDFYVPTARLEDIAVAAAAFVSQPPNHYIDNCWDLFFMKIQYRGLRIEIGGADGARYFDRHAGKWCEADVRFDTSCERTVLGATVPVMPLDQLIEYKRRLDREVDREDIAEIGAVVLKKNSHL